MSAVPAGEQASPLPEAPILNLANVLTGVRILIVPFFLAALLTSDGTDVTWRFIAAVLFAVAAITDRFDGEIARRRGLVTSFGKIADPIADKALMGAALIGLSLLGIVYWWVTVLILGREIGITLMRFWVLRFGVIPASRGGKLKTLVQTFAIGLYLLPLPEVSSVEIVRWTFMAAAVVLTVGTGVDYVARALRLRRTAVRPH
ncbi:CDP-diacylglycerol--glycerol-3-phosphate 3-phosphatidyltransferase [Pseudonocardia sp. WMMC193]|uniref:CDP-diacylglycerol--glycerol-3-phosphate 3-phosphatidyltransferase n=1 Tax=Pseudonocardia sp. WMMC193 TaxID=2911965 RepID=UPI001F032ACE|nr:CDP-diacylglycerol--glycerol-3-phosphate 3-phosphatidyltransferase [Pseudonocardia sp. WMMC193]MCF7550048.1 CDP-diacylglycerol--glycerol-3-phosphate 3-phosphatidyltransferase [Pseudonocardia sp. WMMC193]